MRNYRTVCTITDANLIHPFVTKKPTVKKRVRNALRTRFLTVGYSTLRNTFSDDYPNRTFLETDFFGTISRNALRLIGLLWDD